MFQQKNLNSPLEFHRKFKNLAQAERELLVEIIRAIQECDSQRHYLELGYPSLYKYLVQGIGYSEGAAQRRIDAARLSREIPEVAAKLESGEMTLAHVTQIQKAARNHKSPNADVNSQAATGSGSTPESASGSAQKSVKLEKHELKQQAVSSIYNLSHSQTEKLVAEIFDLPVQAQTKIKTQKDESVRIEITLTKEQFEKLQTAREKLSHQVPDGNIAKVLEILCDKTLTRKRAATMAVNSQSNSKSKSKSKHKDKYENKKFQKPAKVTGEVRLPETETEAKTETKPEAKTKITKALTPKQRDVALEKDGSCRFISLITGKTCGSRWHLQVDHIVPLWAGGTNGPENLQTLCGQHNRHKYEKESGIRKSSD